MKEYRYNYNFIQQWMRVNQITKKEVLDALGIKDYASLNRWINGEYPIHIDAMLRLCNTYNIPLACFFFDSDRLKKIVERNAEAKKIAATIEEIGGREQNEAKVGRGAGRISPEAIIRKQSTRLPDYIDTLSNPIVEKTPIELPVTEDKDSLEILKVKLHYEREIMKIERTARERENEIRKECQSSFDAERTSLLDMIERLNNEATRMKQEMDKLSIDELNKPAGNSCNEENSPIYREGK